MKRRVWGAAASRLLNFTLPARFAIVLPVLFVALSLHPSSAQQFSDPDLTAHEWGTFTSIAGPHGLPVRWRPLTDATDLPNFVEHLNGAYFKLGLDGTVRMETPVLYFYSSREISVSVHVSFAHGLITEWYPHASKAFPSPTMADFTLFQKIPNGTLAWDAVTIEPSASPDCPTENKSSHYYAARETSSSPLRVSGSSGAQHEKFLFYRGVASFSVPLSAKLAPDGSVQIENLSGSAIPNLILFERRGQQSGYRILGPVRDQTISYPPPLSGSAASPQSDLEGILIAQGLFPDEAHAMLETWKDSWFEDGARLIYILPRSFVDSVLPLSIRPAPAQLTRVFIGRIELVTPATQRAVESAFASGDRATLAQYGRFLEPILETMIAEATNPARIAQLRHFLDAIYSGALLRARNEPSRRSAACETMPD
jgi:hypothetical protein